MPSLVWFASELELGEIVIQPTLTHTSDHTYLGTAEITVAEAAVLLYSTDLGF